MRVKIQHKSASFAQTLTYSKAHKKIEHPREETTRAAAKKLGWK